MTRGERCFDVLPVNVGFRPRPAIFDRQLNSHVNVNNDRREQEKTDGPQQRTEIAQMLRVTIDPIWPEKNLQVAKQMSDSEKNQDNAGDRDDHFLSNGGATESGENIHGGFGAPE